MIVSLHGFNYRRLTNKQNKQDKKNIQRSIKYCRPEEIFVIKFVVPQIKETKKWISQKGKP